MLFNNIELSQNEILLILSEKCLKFEKSHFYKNLFIRFFNRYIKDNCEEPENIKFILDNFDNVIVNYAVILDKDILSLLDYKKLMDAYNNGECNISDLNLECGSFASIGDFDKDTQTFLVWRSWF